MTTIKHILLSLLMLCNITLAYGKATTPSDSPQTVTVETTAQLKPLDIIKNPNILADKWLTEPIPISQYTDEEKKLQTLINDKTATAVKTYSTATQDKEWVKYDHEAITPYTWKIIDITLTEANGKTNNVSLLRPNWWIRNIGADRLGNRFYLKIPEVAEGNAVVKAIRANQLDTRLWDEQRNGDYVYRPITATFQHDSNNVLNLYFTNDIKPLGVTEGHPIYSMDKNKFVHAADLKIGEKVKTYQGISTLVKKEKLEGTHKVYNIEVYRDHNYMVSLNSLLVHNGSPVNPKSMSGSNFVVKPLSEIPTNALDVNSVRNEISTYIKAGKKDAFSLATATVTDEAGNTVNLLSVSGKAWKGDVPSNININGIDYKIINADSGSLGKAEANGASNANHAEMKLGSYINDNFGNTNAKVDIAVQNTSVNYSGMCAGCQTTIPNLGLNNEKMKITIYHGTTGKNP